MEADSKSTIRRARHNNRNLLRKQMPRTRRARRRPSDRQKGEKAKEMLEACRDAGLDPLVTSAYRSPLKQAWLLIRKTAVLLNRGEKPTKAWSSAKKLVALPGISEHEMGVAFDACLKQRTEKANAEVQRRLADNS